MSIKGQALADFLLEIPDKIKPITQGEIQKDTPKQADNQSWTMYIDGLSRK